MRTVAIIGVGLIGGSFGLGLRKAGFTGEIVGVSSPAALEAGLRVGAISRTATLEEAATQADLIYLAQPVDRILKTLERLGPLASGGCLVTDAGSTKTAIVEKAAACLQFAAFLGGHPIAGKERRGAASADADLFRNRPYVLTPTEAGSNAAQDFRRWLERFGAQITEMTAQDHDATVAFTSHLPQLLSSALATTLSRQAETNVRRVFGTGLLDMTRLAQSSPDLWLSIVQTNKIPITNALQSLIEVLFEVKSLIQSDNLATFFQTGADFAAQLRGPKNQG